MNRRQLLTGAAACAIAAALPRRLPASGVATTQSTIKVVGRDATGHPVVHVFHLTTDARIVPSADWAVTPDKASTFAVTGE